MGLFSLEIYSGSGDYNVCMLVLASVGPLFSFLSSYPEPTSSPWIPVPCALDCPVSAESYFSALCSPVAAPSFLWLSYCETQQFYFFILHLKI